MASFYCDEILLPLLANERLQIIDRLLGFIVPGRGCAVDISDIIIDRCKGLQ